MKLTWHLIKKDVRRFWPMSLLLVVLVALETLCGARLLGYKGELDTEIFSRVNGYTSILVHLQMLVIALFTTALIQEDSLVGSSSYWMTRPISNRRLLAAKSGAACLLVALPPALTAIPWWVYAGWSPGECVQGVIGMMVTSGAIALFASPVALVTPNLGRFLLAIFLGLLTFCGVLMVAAAWGWQGNFPSTLAVDRALVSALLLLAVTLAVIVIQLWPRRTRLATNVLACGFLAALIAMVAWPWDLPLRSGVGGPGAPATRAITLRAADVHLTPGLSTRLPAYRFDFDVSDVPRDYFVSGETTPGQRLLWPDTESEIRVTGRFIASPVVPQAAALLGLAQAPSEPRYTTRLSTTKVIQPNVVDRFRHEPPTYEMAARFRLHAPSLRGEVPLKAGSIIAGESSRTRIVRIAYESNDLRVSVIESLPSAVRSLQVVRLHSGNDAPYSIYSRAHHHYLVHRRLGRLIEGAPFPGRGKPIRYCSIAFVEIFWRELVFPAHNENSEPDEALGESDELTFASLASKEIATFERKLVFRSSMFPLPPSAETRDQ